MLTVGTSQQFVGLEVGEHSRSVGAELGAEVQLIGTEGALGEGAEVEERGDGDLRGVGAGDGCDVGMRVGRNEGTCVGTIVGEEEGEAATLQVGVLVGAGMQFPSLVEHTSISRHHKQSTHRTTYSNFL